MNAGFYFAITMAGVGLIMLLEDAPGYIGYPFTITIALLVVIVYYLKKISDQIGDRLK